MMSFLLEILYMGAFFEIWMPFHFLDGRRLNDDFLLEILYICAYFEICMPFHFLDGGNCSLSKLVIYGI